jgi:hypothetical protein
MVMVVEEEEKLFDYTASPKQHFVLSEFQVAEKSAAMAHQLLSWDGERRNSIRVRGDVPLSWVFNLNSMKAPHGPDWLNIAVTLMKKAIEGLPSWEHAPIG